MKKILIVDDNPDIRALLHATLDLAQSFEIHEAIDGVTAVEMARSLKPDLVLMDIMMPGEFDGLEACRRIKQVAGEGEVAPKVLLVGQPTRGVDIGAIEFIYTQLRAMRDAGCAVLVVSSELDEILALSDRVMVMNHGRVTGELPIAQCTEAGLGLLMTAT